LEHRSEFGGLFSSEEWLLLFQQVEFDTQCAVVHP
jgi:hypothetical protein